MSIRVRNSALADDQLLKDFQPGGTGTDRYQGIVVCDAAGNVVDSLAATPAGTERGLAVRHIGVLGINDAGGSLTVDAPITAPLNIKEEMPGYAPVAIYLEAAAGATAEALTGLVKVTNGTTAAAATSISPTAGKTLVVESIWMQAATTSTAMNLVRGRIRINPVGAALATSGIAWTARSLVTSPSAVANQGHDPVVATLGDRGLRVPAGGGLGFTYSAVAATYTIDLMLVGYEYTP